ncbi:non-canonical purine NTP pyrophosphatase [Vibrio sp. D431a]|uniref:non-canonical purine NTP pyrophosphatase n=1 Tax=Vibrio sp. D431a TaxID=2837388 RepID=UPI0025579207|nr:non-canonical purine NTP pyrophosphatase [Vibrio sp. D431a]MDK9789758.1 hypothetical protein [Vibrio sp. D431a]
MKLVTSNTNKLQEFNRFGLNVQAQSGKDLPEVLGTPEEVITYKAMAAGENLLVEDTILIIDGKEVVDIKGRLAELDRFEEIVDAQWLVSIAVIEDGILKTCQASIKGYLVKPSKPFSDAFGFDGHFHPNGANGASLHELELNGDKDLYSARKDCVVNFLGKKGNYKERKVSEIPPWTGEYQKL